MNLFILFLIIFLISFILTYRKKLNRLDKILFSIKSDLQNISENLSRKEKEFNAIISSVPESIVILNKEGKISFCNENFKKITDIENPQGKFYWETLRNSDFNKMVEKVKKEKKDLEQEIEHNGNTFLVRISFLPEDEEILVLFQNLTEFKKLEKIKRDFVANVSHELRTPLTAIKGYVETLEEEIEGDKKHYLEIIKKHTDKLMNIVEDLLLLSELEEKGGKLELDEVNLVPLVENVSKIFKTKAEEKGLELKLHAEKFPIIKGDSLKLEQMFVNLIDNAIKYTEKGEIIVYLKEENNQIKIEVKDTGIGIPKEHLDRIFERFYVVDKSRSQKLGGTGLGLSIVKHIVLLHKGKIDVESQVGKGTKFIISLPLFLA